MTRESASPGFMLNIHAEPDSVQAAFLRRALAALERIASSVPTKTLTEALAAPTDVGSLAQLLSRSEVVGSAITELDPLAPALARGVEHRQTLLKLAGGILSADEAGRILGITRQAVDKRRRAGALLAVREGSDWRYPVCQFEDGEVVAGIPEVVRGFSSSGPWVALDFLLAPDTVLAGRTPLEALKAGDREEVLRLVRGFQGDGFA
ncbi:helix-turn-helix domain-containing protein [Microvirga tunisiensis]|uniref:Helix-turn-helix domain-containing protein n=1 Tax=Microvirga tunisiensis TaxID=2108360 RepID=A0A5N7MPI4_9HYPH|nr:helix-turn-helix domain-containing protein [Microvirga tunisiensis]MPR10303.1 helix-turn-helix domain-containing protein [Microvirga tunisiensis]MPR28931.1 helix-turn-helix domain-containing protein [Microvirga tunisiensis]